MDKKALKFFCNHGKIDCPECQPIPAPSSPEVKEALPLEWLKLLPKDDRDYLLKPGPLSDYPGLNGILGRLAAEVRRLTGEVGRWMGAAQDADALQKMAIIKVKEATEVLTATLARAEKAEAEAGALIKKLAESCDEYRAENGGCHALLARQTLSEIYHNWSEEGGGLIIPTGYGFALYEVPQFGGEPRFASHHNTLDAAKAEAEKWT